MQSLRIRSYGIGVFIAPPLVSEMPWYRGDCGSCVLRIVFGARSFGLGRDLGLYGVLKLMLILSHGCAPSFFWLPQSILNGFVHCATHYGELAIFSVLRRDCWTRGNQQKRRWWSSRIFRCMARSALGQHLCATNPLRISSGNHRSKER